MRLCLGIALIAGAILLGAQRADALTEVCPASMGGMDTPGTKTDAPATLYAFGLQSLSTETVNGTIVVDTDHGFFTLPFGPTKLTPHIEHLTYDVQQFTRTDYFSDASYVRFPIPVQVKFAFVSLVQTDSTQFHWPTTPVPCEYDGGYPKASGSESIDPLMPSTGPDLSVPPAPGIAIATATATSAFDALPCKNPFVEGRTSYTGVARFPDNARGFMSDGQPQHVILRIIVGKDGRLVDAWPYIPSPIRSLNDAAEAAARESTYVAPISRCLPAMGDYLFRADFAAPSS